MTCLVGALSGAVPSVRRFSLSPEEYTLTNKNTEPFPADSANLIQLVCNGNREGELLFRGRFERGARSLCTYRVPAEYIDECLDQIFSDVFAGIRAGEFHRFDCLASYLRHVLTQVVAQFADRTENDPNANVAFETKPFCVPPETLARYRTGVMQLAAEERNSLHAYYVDCKSHESIAREMGVSVDDVLFLKERAKQRLQNFVRSTERATDSARGSARASGKEIQHPQFFTAQ